MFVVVKEGNNLFSVNFPSFLIILQNDVENLNMYPVFSSISPKGEPGISEKDYIVIYGRIMKYVGKLFGCFAPIHAN